MTDTEKRAEYIKGLRALADLLDSHPELEAPYTDSLLVIPDHDRQRESLRAWARALPGEKRKAVRDSGYFDLFGELHGIKVQVIAYRDEVCRKVVKGTREVTKTIPDPTVEIPTVEITETVEDVEWICEPILDTPASAEAVA